MTGNGRLALAVGAALVAYLVAQRARRALRERRVLADLILELGHNGDVEDQAGNRKVRRELPAALLDDLAAAFGRIFASRRMYEVLYGGTLKWRRKLLEALFRVNAVMALRMGRARFLADRQSGASGRNRWPRVTCFASAYASSDRQPGVFDVVAAGGLSTFASMGSQAFLRSYMFEQWLVALKAAAVPKPEYFGVDYLFVRRELQCHGLGSHLLQSMLGEARARRLPVLVMVTDVEAADFFARHSFVLLRRELYSPGSPPPRPAPEPRESLVGEDAPGTFSVWLFWRETVEQA